MDTRRKGFVERRRVAESYQCSEKTVIRAYNKAVRVKDDATLKHFQLVTSDGEMRGGETVNPEIVRGLQADKKNPSWWVRESYLEKQYGRKSKPETTREEGSDQPEKPEPAANRVGDSGSVIIADVVAVLKDQLGKKDEQLAEKDWQIRELSGRLRESHILEMNLQSRLGQLPPEVQASLGLPTSGSVVVSTASGPGETSVVAPEKDEGDRGGSDESKPGEVFDVQAEGVGEPKGEKSNTAYPARKKAKRKRKKTPSNKNRPPKKQDRPVETAAAKPGRMARIWKRVTMIGGRSDTA